MNVLITGGAGFIGGWVGQKLVERGDDVISIDVRKPEFPVPGIQYIEADIMSDIGNECLQGCEYVLHLAAQSNTRKCRDEAVKSVITNCATTQAIFEAAHMFNKKMLFASTTLLGSCAFNGGEETWFEPPKDLYCATKLFGESVARRFGAVIARFGICYGPRMTPGVLFDTFIKKALNGETLELHGGGDKVWRQYTYVEDLAEGVVKAMNGRGTYNIAREDRVTPIRVVELLRAIMDEKGKWLKYISVPAREEEIELKVTMRNLRLQWEPNTDLLSGLRKTVEWYEGRMDA